MAYQRVNWQSGTKVADGYVEINGTRHTTVQPQYSGNTPINPTSLNIMDEGIEENSKMLNGKLTVENITLDKIEFKNKFDKNTITENSIIDLDGSEVSGKSGWCATDFIPIKANTKYVYQGITNQGSEKYSAYYDSNKQFISYFRQETGINKRITTPNGAQYIRFSMLTSDKDTFQLELGEYSTEYTPYKEFTIPEVVDSLNNNSTIDAPSVHAVNEKFSAINNYSTSERIVGIYKDGKPIYKKTVYISSLPNAQQQGYAHNIPNIDTVVDAVAVAHTDNTTAHIPYIGVTSNLNIGMFANLTEITFVVGADRTNWDADVDMYYTKTTD